MRILLQKLVIVGMRYLHGGRIISHMGRIKLRSFKMRWRKFKQIITDPRKRFLNFLGNYKRLIRMRRNIGIRKVGICGIHLEILIPNFTML